MTKPIRVTLFDDNKDIRDSLTMLLSNSKKLEFAGAYPDAREAEIIVEDEHPDVLLMDIDMPEINGIEAVKKLRIKFPDIFIIMLTVFDDDDKIFNAICTGANGYILKTRSLDFISNAIDEVVLGGAPMSPSIARKVLHLFKQNNSSPNKEVYDLSKRETEVLQLLVNGDSYKMIADKLNIAYATVNTHLTNIYRKLHVNSIGEAVSKALRNHITP